MHVGVCLCTSADRRATALFTSSSVFVCLTIHPRPQVREESSSEGEEGEELNNKKKKEFCGLDYSAATPSWAVYGSLEAGFNPSETRQDTSRKTRRKRYDRFISCLLLRLSSLSLDIRPIARLLLLRLLPLRYASLDGTSGIVSIFNLSLIYLSKPIRICICV